MAYCPSLVRGQGYYTGMVFEVTCPQFSGAVAGGGRYDNMVGKFLGVQVPAVGFSIGFERVCGILLEQGYQIPGAKQKLALLYLKDADFAAVLAKAAKERGINLETAAEAYGNHVDMLPDFDLVVLAPQAASYLADLQKDCERVGNKCVACRGKQYIELSQNGDKSLAFVSEQLSK